MPSRLFRTALAAALTACVASASATCPNTRAIHVRITPKQDGYFFYYLLGDLTFRVTVEGKSFHMDDKRVPGHRLFQIDDKTLQLQRVDRKDFASFVSGDGEQATLDAQARYEQHYVRTMAPEAKITDLGTRTRTDDAGGNTKVFRLWTYEVADDSPTYFLSTLLDKDTVAMVTANLPGSQAAALESLRDYAGSLQLVPAGHCANIKWK